LIRLLRQFSSQSASITWALQEQQAQQWRNLLFLFFPSTQQERGAREVLACMRLRKGGKCCAVLLVACVRSAASFHIDRVSKSFPACLSWQQHRLIPKPAIGCFPIFASAGPLVWCDSPLAAGRGTSSASVRLLRCERHGICFTTEWRRECRRKLTAETSASPRVSQSVREAKADGTNWVGEMRREGLRECG
jgi:hypothetical protein